MSQPSQALPAITLANNNTNKDKGEKTMKNTKISVSETIAQKKAMLEMLENVITDIEYRENSILTNYEPVGEEQRKDNDGNLLYLDENGEKTTDVTDKPAMRTIYKDVKRDPSELDDYDRPRYEAIMKIKEAVMALI